MNQLKEEAFFHTIASKLIDFVSKASPKTQVLQYKKKDKEKLNVFTSIDISVEDLIIREIRKRFPKDKILSEESFDKENIRQKSRLWIIDPICGTINLSRGISIFCTNIALAIDSKIVAGCVIDHSKSNYIWSIGQGKIYINKKLYIPIKNEGRILIDINLGCIPYCNPSTKQKYTKFINKLIEREDFTLMSQTTSLSFAYVSLGKVDAYISPFNHLWDLPAINFLIEQAGGAVTDIKGKPWTLDKPSAIAALDKKLHKKLLALLAK